MLDMSADISSNTSRSTYRSTLDRYVDRHIGRHSADMSTDTSVDCRSRGVQNTHDPFPVCMGENVKRHLSRNFDIFFNKNDLPQCLVVFSNVLSLFSAIEAF